MHGDGSLSEVVYLATAISISENKTFVCIKLVTSRPPHKPRHVRPQLVSTTATVQSTNIPIGEPRRARQES